ncbi:alpha-amylase family glycosyl hydrolase [Blautia schinkii]|nr:alpha-amylase family glycosyl hydrolase [Blautia schinkii]
MERVWWKEAVVYQIYPRSFMDSSGDGIGDIKGITSKMGYLKELGIDVIWLYPVSESLSDDDGYGIRMEQFGALEDFDELLLSAHRYGIKTVVDFVGNIASGGQSWYIERRTDADNLYRDYYIRRPGKDGREPGAVIQFRHMDVNAEREHTRTEQTVNRKDQTIHLADQTIHLTDGKINLPEMKRALTKWLENTEGTAWNGFFWGNHEQPRSVSRYGEEGEYREMSAKMLATCLHMMQGTPCIYQGEELGMTNPSSEEICSSRDNARTPFQWNSTAHGGFTTGEPWIQVNPNYRTVNAREQIERQDSVFRYYQSLIRLRKEYPVIVYGSFELLYPDSAEIFAYIRALEDEKLLVLCNFTPELQTIHTPQEFYKAYPVITSCTVPKTNQTIILPPYGAAVYLTRF